MIFVIGQATHVDCAICNEIFSIEYRDISQTIEVERTQLCGKRRRAMVDWLRVVLEVI